MISRRNIRVNVFQTLYEQMQQNEKNIDETIALQSLHKKINQTESLLVCIWHFVILLADYNLIHANQKTSKHRPTEEDLNTPIKLANNIIVDQLKRNEKFSDLIKKHKLAHLFDVEFVRTIFLQLVETNEYKLYSIKKDRNGEEEKKMIEFIIKNCIYENDIAASFFSEKYMNWDNDKDMIFLWNEKILLNAGNYSFHKIISNTKLEYSEDLIKTYIDKYDFIADLIKPKLVNWEADRVAIIDIILLHLGISEMLYFPTIPLKVTINEYIDLAKEYSTLQSGQFVNGLLDNVRKDLEQQNKIHKTQFQKK